MRAHRDKAEVQTVFVIRTAGVVHCSRVGPEGSQEIAPLTDPLLD